MIRICLVLDEGSLLFVVAMLLAGVGNFEIGSKDYLCREQVTC